MVMLTRPDYRGESPYQWTGNPYWASPMHYSAPQRHSLQPAQRFPSALHDKDYAMRQHLPAVVSNTTRNQRATSDHRARFSEPHHLTSAMSHSQQCYTVPMLAAHDMHAMQIPAGLIPRRMNPALYNQSLQIENRSRRNNRIPASQPQVQRKPVPQVSASEQPRRRSEMEFSAKPASAVGREAPSPQSALRNIYGQRASNLRSPLCKVAATASTSSFSSTTSSSPPSSSYSSSSRSPALTTATTPPSSSSSPSLSSQQGPCDTRRQQSDNNPVAVVQPSASRSLELRRSKEDQDKEARRYSTGDSILSRSAPTVPLVRTSLKPVKEAKTRRVTSAQPYIMERPADDQASLISKETSDTTLSRNPTFWNPRTSLSSLGNSSVGSIAPIGRNFSRKLRGFLHPHRAHIDSATKEQYAADQAWSVDRSITPMKTHKEGKSKPDPFRIISKSLEVTDGEKDPDAEPLKFKKRDFELIDKYSASVQQRGPLLTPQVLAQKFLARPYQCELQKIRAIFMWVVQNIDIRQDRDHWESREEDTAEKVLAYRQCQSSAGIAKLFCRMIKSAGIEDCQVVSGYLRAPKDSIDAVMRANGQLTENHAWCMVKVKGEYRFVDCWLASPFLAANMDKMESHWFLTKPSDLIYTHYPTKSYHQCLEPVVSANTFFALPCVWTPYFKHRMQAIEFDPSTLDLVDDEVCHISIRVNDGIQCYAEVETRGGLDRGTIVTKRVLAQCLPGDVNGRTERVCKIKAVLPPDQVMGWLKIYAGPCTRSSSSTLIDQNQQQDKPPLALCFRLTHRGKSSPFEFVQINPSPNEFYVHEPQCHQLFPLQSYNFHIQGIQQSHHKLAVRSPSGRLFKLMYYPQDRTYVGSVTTSEIGKWSLICLLPQAGGWSVVASWDCRA